ncbi:molybdopterin molybdotransferase MoeA [Clostridium lacusfryxellense]|uniref:molybdopterin molybdotransferase MoeA n=1 Tax=Clostridium lacusfryxellense TaxID=205328 RepID=UPI001C0E51D9|nr:gephyrin-like molybdotransferase Glp [Clostridium lacusfryxellense]MBU3109973.1 molybdopterin molybdotransferase MoeA [Clostridium lacusfryxellense]
MIEVYEAKKIINDEVKLLERNCIDEKVYILDSLNRVLSVDIYSNDNLPPFDKSAMDGYAIRSCDTQNKENVILKIKSLIKAGDYCTQFLKENEAFKIMTGAMVPSGADAVIQIEKVTTDKDNLYISGQVKKDNNIIKFGEEILEGDIALKKGSLVRPPEIGLLASLGYEFFNVYKSPTIGIVITGDELLDINCDLEKGKIRNSNEYSLKALIKSANAEVFSVGIVKDDKKVLKEKILLAFEKSDIVLSSGGASVGDYDFVLDILREIKADIKFTSVAIKPGKPLTFAVYNDKLFFALPGNPQALINTFEEFVKPAIKSMIGNTQNEAEEFKVYVKDDFKAKVGREKYVFVNIKKEDGVYNAYKLGSQCSNHLLEMCNSNGVIIIPKECGNVKVGDAINGKFIFK